MTPSRQEIDHPTSPSSSSTSPTTTSSTVSSDSVIRQELGDLLTKSTKNTKPNKNEGHDLERGDLLNSEIVEWLQEFRENLVDDIVPEHRDSHAGSSHEPSLELVRSSIWVKTVLKLTSLMTEIARSARGPELQEPHAEDALAEPYLVQKILVT